MAALSSTKNVHPSNSKKRYDVFLSFRGIDTRSNFTDHLHAALHAKGILTFRDDLELLKGKPITDLFKAIEESRIAVVILSSNYASSRWCLDEIVKIVDCMNESGLIVLPVFYKVQPSDVRHQTGCFEEHFAGHERKNIITQNWRQAFTQVANLSGYSIDERPETKVIQEIVERIFTELNLTSKTTLSTALSMDFVGVHRVKEIELELGVGLDDIRAVGICGMPGIGKTTIAKIVFESNCHEFEASSFIANVGELAKKEGVLHMQKQLYQDLLNSEVTLKNIHAVRSRLRNKRVLVILDSVNELEEIEALTGKGGDGLKALFAPGSRIIITTSNEKLLNDYGARIYKVERLTEDEALLLFCCKAFKKEVPVEEFSDLSYKFLDYAAGLPLALVVLGSSLYGRPLNQWSSKWGKVSTNNVSQSKINDILRISLDGLDDAEKEIFLDIACYFNGEDSCRLTKIFESCGYEPVASIPILVEKSLVSIVGGNLWMHILLQETGKQIVHAESRKIGERSRLWIPTETIHLLKNAKGTELVTGIFLSPAVETNVPLKSDPFSEMSMLRLLKIRNVIFSGCLVYDLSNELRLLQWDRFPLASLPSSFEPDKLVELYLPQSRIEHLWEEISMPSLEMLVILDLSDCEYLRATPNFNAIPMLEMLVLKGCKSLAEVHPSVGVLQGLVCLNLKGCECLTTLPHKMSLISLRTFILSGCCKLEKLPEIGENMKQLSELHLDGTAMKDLPISIKNLTGLLVLNLKDCKNLSSLPDIICTLKSLQTLNLQDCSNLSVLPEKLGSLENLKVLDASRSGIRQVPSSLLELRNLENLSFEGCRDMPDASSSGSVSSNSGLQLPPSFSGLSSLDSLNLSNCSLSSIPDDIDCLSSLKYLDLSENDFESLPVGISKLSQLEQLRLKDCTNLRILPQVPSSIRSMTIIGCPFLEKEDDNVFTSAHGFAFIHGKRKLWSPHSKMNLPPAPILISEHHILREKFETLFEDYIYRQKSFVYHSVRGTFRKKEETSVISLTKIPKWFRRSTASSIQIPLPQDFDGHNSNVMGLGLFFVCELQGSFPDANENPCEDELELLYSTGSHEAIYHGSCHIYTNDEDPHESPLVHELYHSSNNGWPATCLYWIYIPREDFAERLSKGSIRAEIMPEVKVKECGAGLIKLHNVPTFINYVLGAFGQDQIRIPEPEQGTSVLQFLGPNLQREKSTDEPELQAVQSARLERSPYFMEIEPCAPGDHSSSSTTIVGQLKEKVQLLLEQLFEGGNAAYYDYGFVLSVRVRTILPWFRHHSIGSDVAIPHTPPDLHRDKTWLGISVYAAFNVSPGLTFTCACYLMTVTEKYLVRIIATCTVEDSPSGSHRICIIHIPRARIPEQWDQYGKVFASFDVLVPGGFTKVDMCGVSVLYQQDLEGLNQTVTNCCIRSPPVYYGRDNRTDKVIPGGQLIGTAILQSSLVDVAESWYRSLRKRSDDSILQRSFSTIQEFSGLYIFIPSFPPFEERDTVILWKRNLELLLQSFLRLSKLSITLVLRNDDIFRLGSFDPHSVFSVVFPQNDIPEWVSRLKFPSKTFRLPLPPNFYSDEDSMGVVVCASFTVHPTPAEVQSYLDSDVYPVLTCHISCCQDPDHPSGSWQCHNMIGIGPNNEFMWLYRRSFIWLLYIPLQYIKHHYCNNQLVASFTSDSTHVVGVHRCGMRVLHKHNVEEFQQTTRRCFTSFFDDEDLIRRYVKHVKQVSPGSGFCMYISVETDSKTDMLLVPHDDLKNSTLHQNLLDYDRFLTFNSCYPPNEIAKWFEYQSFGPEISMPLPPNLDRDANWIGIAFCVSFSCIEDAIGGLSSNMRPGMSHHLSCYFETNIGSLQPLHDYCTPNNEFQWLHLGGFIWLSYIPRTWFLDQLNECGRLEASVVSSHGGFKVDKFRLLLVYQHQEEELKQTIMLCNTTLLDIYKEKQVNEAAGASTISAGGSQSGGTTSAAIASKDQEFDRVSTYNSCFPPENIIEWFGHYSNGPSVKIPLPPHLQSNTNWIGLAMCAHFSLLDHSTTNRHIHPDTPHHLTCYLETDACSKDLFHSYMSTNEELKWLHLVGFIWVSYIPRSSLVLDHQLDECNTLQASIGSDHPGFRVLKCGLRLLYEHDEQEFKMTIMHCRSKLSDQPNKEEKSIVVGGETGASSDHINDVAIRHHGKGVLE